MGPSDAEALQGEERKATVRYCRTSQGYSYVGQRSVQQRLRKTTTCYTSQRYGKALISNGKASLNIEWRSKAKAMLKPEIIHMWYLSIQACVPNDWTDRMVEEWFGSAGYDEDLCLDDYRVRPDESVLNDDGIPSHVPCPNKPEFQHVILDV